MIISVLTMCGSNPTLLGISGFKSPGLKTNRPNRIYIINVFRARFFSVSLSALSSISRVYFDFVDVKVAVPVKWLAPETLKTVNSSKPTYNEKTDVWSFAVTVWEIYSKGKMHILFRQLEYCRIHEQTFRFRLLTFSYRNRRYWIMYKYQSDIMSRLIAIDKRS